MAGRISTKTIAYIGLMIALVFLVTRFLSVPGTVTPGYINLGDSIIMLAAIILGGPAAAVAGAFGSALADIAYGAFIFAPVTFVVKGIEGLVIGLVYSSKWLKSGKHVKMAMAFIIGAIIMVSGYFLFEWLILGQFDQIFGFAYAIRELPLNIVQGVLCCIIGFVLSVILTRVNAQKLLK